MKARRIAAGVVTIVTILMIGVCGCAMNNTNSPDNKNNGETLSERQKTILSEQGLSTDYNELTSSQRKAIEAIEKMLEYAESKYDMAFSYAGYAAGSAIEEEHMRAYLSSGIKETDCFTITKTKTGYEDDFIGVAARDSFSDYVCEQIKPFVNSAEVKVFAEITRTSLQAVPTNASEFDGNVESSLWIFIDGATLVKDDINGFVAQYKDFMSEHKLYGATQVIVLKEGKINYLTKLNYTNYLSEEFYTIRENVYLNK